MTRVSVTIVTWDSERFIERCLHTVGGQDHRDLEVVIVDNGSGDATRELVARSPVPSRVILNPENRGFAAAQNQAIAASTGETILVLNPDILLRPDFVSTALRGFGAAARAGMIAPKLVRTTDEFEIPGPGQARIDSTGMFLTASLRHFDRGAGERDLGQYERTERVFGPSGAAALYSRALVEDVSVRGEFFDELFFAYREDADVAWRARLFGWECVYVPGAVAYHLRRVRPELGRNVPPEINLHSVKNRFLMRIKNITPDMYARVLVAATARDLLVVAGALVLERRSLAGLALVARHLPRMREVRREIQRRRRHAGLPIRRWVGRRSMALDGSRPRPSGLTGPRFGIDAHSAEREGEGNSTYSRGLISALFADGGDDLTLFAGNPEHPFYRSLPAREHSRVVGVAQGRGLARLTWALTWAAARERVDGLHVQYTAPLGYHGPLVVTVHDLGFLHVPESFPLALRVALRVLVARSLARASRIITDSEFARRDIVAHYAIPPHKIAVVPLAAVRRFQPLASGQTSAVLGRYGLTPGFFFSLGRLNRRKNLERLLMAYANVRARVGPAAQLVICGKPDYGVEETLRWARLSGDAPGVRFVGLVPDEDLPALYGGAAAFVYPSLFEGFGLPVLEAMASGTPVVTSNRAALPELTADAALAVDPESVDALTDAMVSVVTDADLAADLRRRGLERSRRYSWEETARCTRRVYDEALRGGRS